MHEKPLRIGFALTGSHCTIPQIWEPLKNLVDEGHEVFPIVSESVRATNTRFGTAESTLNRLQDITGRFPWMSIVEVEPIGPKRLLDVMIVAPCTGTTLAKLTLGISDTVVTLACKAHMRNNRPVILAIATNDALGGNAANIGHLLARKNIFFVPYRQDNPKDKPNSMVARLELLTLTIQEAMMEGRQTQPVVLL
jgi:dipicolinate synthase subunit B